MSVREPYIDQHLLIPLATLFDDPLAPERKKFYVEAVKFRTDTELRDAFAFLRDNHKYQRFPSIADIQHAIKVSKQLASRPSSGPAQYSKQPWDERNEKCHSESIFYAKEFMDSRPIAMEAKREGWDYPLWRYVAAAAFVQSQMISPNGPKSFGWSSVDIFGAGAIIEPADISQFIKAQKAQADMGRIDVGIPSGAIQRWKAFSSSAKIPVENHSVAAYAAKSLAKIDHGAMLDGDGMVKQFEENPFGSVF